MDLKQRVEKTVSYLNSERCLANWLRNAGWGFSFEQNLFAAVQTATGLRVYERIREVMDEINKQLLEEEKAA